jgi:hypothetical protein
MKAWIHPYPGGALGTSIEAGGSNRSENKGMQHRIRGSMAGQPHKAPPILITHLSPLDPLVKAARTDHN